MRKIILIALLIHPNAFAGAFQKPEFSIEVPSNWNEIPQSYLSKVAESFNSKFPTSDYQKQNYSFQPGLKWLTNYPYLLIEIHPSKKFTKNDLATSSRINLDEISAKTKNYLSGAVDHMNFGQPMYDEKANVIWIFVKGKVANVGDVTSINGIIPTEKGSINVSGSRLSKDFNKNLPVFQKIITSIKVNSSLAYKFN